MRERVHLCGGTFSAGPLPDGGFQVTAALPLPPAGRSAAGSQGTAGGASTGGGSAPVTIPLAADSPRAGSLAADGSFTPGVGDGITAPLGAVATGGGGRG